MTELQWTQLSAELKAAESSTELFEQMLTRTRKLDAAVEASEVPENPEEAPPPADNRPTSDAADTTSSLDEAESGGSANPPF